MAKPRPVRGRIPLTQAAALIDITSDRLRDYANAGLIPCYRVAPRAWMYFELADIAAFIEAMGVSADSSTAAASAS